MKVCLVTGIGHAGTQWIAHALDRPEQGVRFVHELAYNATKITWAKRQMLGLEKGLAAQEFNPYWDAVKDKPGVRWLGDSMSWHPIEAAQVAAIGAFERIIYLVRNGIQQLHSIAYHSTWGNVRPDHPIYGLYLKRYWDMARPGPVWEKWTPWEKLCLWWETNDFMPAWLNGYFQGDRDLFTFRFEDLVTRPVLLQELFAQFDLPLTEEEARNLQAVDKNRKVAGDRSPEVLWAKWRPDQREAFRRICGPGMERFGYEIPKG